MKYDISKTKYAIGSECFKDRWIERKIIFIFLIYI